MINKRFHLVFLFVWCFASLSGAESDFTKAHKVLTKYCGGCHNDTEPTSEFSVQTYSSLLKGGDDGPAVVAGKSLESRMIQMMRGDDTLMPPEDDPDLPRPSVEEIAAVAEWIDAGAKNTTVKAASTLNTPSLVPVKDLTPAVTAVDWSSRNLIAVSRFRNVELIDAESMKVVDELSQFPGKVNSLRFSRDGKRLVVASGVTGVSGHAVLVDAETGESIREFNGHSDTIYQAIESPDGKLIATGSYDRKILVWNAGTGEIIRELAGHNAAIYDLDFSHDSKNLISASGDQTVKICDVHTGARLDTLGQPLKEQFTTRFSPDKGNRLIVSAGRDKRIRVWEFNSRESQTNNPLLHARFAHVAPIVAVRFSADGTRLVSSSEDRTIKVWDTQAFEQIGDSIIDQSDVCGAIALSPDASQVFVGRMDGTVELFDLPTESVNSGSGHSERRIANRKNQANRENPDAETSAETAAEKKIAEIEELEPNNVASSATAITLPARVSGRIHNPKTDSDEDLYRFTALRGKKISLWTSSTKDESPIDSRIEILHPDGRPVPWVKLRAIRDSYFTFRGKDSSTSDDFRVHNWQEMNLNDYLYANGEVVKLMFHPRGPDSGFKVFPGFGSRHTWFGTTALAHPLHEPCYIVEVCPPGAELQPNGLPEFLLNYENDDDSARKLGKDSRLLFDPPVDGDWLVRVTDVRGFQGEKFKYELNVTEADPAFRVSLSHPAELSHGGGREFTVTAERIDGFDGEIVVEIGDVPESLSITSKVVIEAGQLRGFGTMHLVEKSAGNAPSIEEFKGMTVKARGMIGGQSVVEPVNGFGEIKVLEKSKAKIRIVAADDSREIAEIMNDADSAVELTARPGELLEAKVVAQRLDHKGRIGFGNEDSGRNLPHGVYVADIGLNGLMITKDKDQQRFFIQVEDWVQPCERLFHVRTGDAGNQASVPVLLKIVEEK